MATLNLPRRWSVSHVSSRAREGQRTFSTECLTGGKLPRCRKTVVFARTEGTSNILIGQWLYTRDETLSGKQCIFLGAGTILPWSQLRRAGRITLGVINNSYAENMVGLLSRDLVAATTPELFESQRVFSTPTDAGRSHKNDIRRDNQCLCHRHMRTRGRKTALMKLAWRAKGALVPRRYTGSPIRDIRAYDIMRI